MSKISELSDGGSLQSTDYLIAVRSGGNVKVQLSELPSGIGAGGNIVFGDNEKAIFGAGSDLQIYHSGTHSFISDQGTGNMLVLADNFEVNSASNTANKITAATGGAVTLFHNNAAKLATTATGIDVTGTATVNQVNINSATYDNRQLGIDSTGFFVYNAADARYDMVISDAGNVGIGRGSSSVVRLSVAGTDATSSNYAFEATNNSNATRFIVRNDGQSQFFKSDNSASMTVTSAGNVGIGSTNPNAKLTLVRSGAGILANGDDGTVVTFIADTTGSVLTYGTFTSHPVAFKTNNAERMRLSGSTLIFNGTTTGVAGSISFLKEYSTGSGTFIAPTSLAFWNRDSSASVGTVLLFQNGGVSVGSITHTNSATSYNTSSDVRLKENIADAEDAGAKVDAIQVRQFDWKEGGEHQDYGMIAQELLTVAPEAVSGDPESDDMMGVDYSKLVPMLVKEIQSLRARVAQLEGA